MAPLDSVLDIDGNRHVSDRLRALIESRRTIAFSGAGASAVLYPLWPELVQLLIGEVVKGGLASDADRATWERLRSICAHSRERRSKPAGRGQAGSHRQPLLFLHTIASPFAARPVAPWSELRQYSPGR